MKKSDIFQSEVSNIGKPVVRVLLLSDALNVCTVGVCINVCEAQTKSTCIAASPLSSWLCTVKLRFWFFFFSFLISPPQSKAFESDDGAIENLFLLPAGLLWETKSPLSLEYSKHYCLTQRWLSPALHSVPPIDLHQLSSCRWGRDDAVGGESTGGKRA